MQISLRSQLMAGAFAVVGTSAIAIAPIGQSSLALGQLTPSVHSAETALAAFANPFNAILGSANLVNNDLFNSLQTYPGDIPQGIIPQLLGNPLPVARQFGDNLSFYFGNAVAALVTGPTSSANVFATMVWTLPEQLSTAFTELISGDFQGALDTLVNTFIAPIPYIIDGFVNAISTPITNVIQHAVNVLMATPGIVADLFATGVEALSALTAKAVEVGVGVFTALTSFNFEGAWNTYVNGALGPGGFPGLLEQLTMGPGATVPSTDGPVFINSFRGWATQTQETLRLALTTIASSDEEPAPAAAAAAQVAAAGAAAAESSVASSAESSVASSAESSVASGAESSVASSAESSVASNAKAAVAADDSDAGAPAGAASSDDNSAPAGDSKSEAKADTGSKAGAGSAKSSGGKGHGKSHGSARKAADN